MKAFDEPKKTFHHGNLRVALLHSAVRLLDEGGIERVTIRGVARLSGVSHSAPVNHFADRRRLLTGLATNLFLDLEGWVEAALPSDGLPRERIRAFALALLEFGLQHPERYRLLWRCDLLDMTDEALNTAADGIYATLLKEISALPESTESDPHTIATGLWSLCHGYLSMRLDGMFEERCDSVTGEPRLLAMVDRYIR